MAVKEFKIMAKNVPMIKAATQSMRTWFSEDLKKHDQLMTLLDTYHKVHLHDNDNYAEKLTWSLQHCNGKFRDIRHGDGMYWYFEKEEDATMFALKWF
jgi:hypothetical protein